MFDIEIKYGLLQISEGLAFLHDSAKMLHRNISPEAILINEAGAWKICGFEYCLANSAGPGQEPSWSFPEYDHGQPPETYPQVDIFDKTCIPVISLKRITKVTISTPTILLHHCLHGYLRLVLYSIMTTWSKINMINPSVGLYCTGVCSFGQHHPSCRHVQFRNGCLFSLHQACVHRPIPCS